MNVEIGAEAALFPEKEYINGIAVAVCAELILSALNFSSLLYSVLYCMYFEAVSPACTMKLFCDRIACTHHAAIL